MKQHHWLSVACALYLLSLVTNDNYWSGLVYTLAVFAWGVTASKHMIVKEK